MRLGLYAICRDEGGYVERWMNTLLAELQPGDSITVVDTGSTDNTLRELRRLSYQQPNIHIHSAAVKPWRFDAARNVALSLVPAEMDMVWSLDLDEFPQPGWRKEIEQAYEAARESGLPSRLRYHFTWNFLEDGSPGYQFWADKLHARAGFIWKGIAHEWLEADLDTWPHDRTYGSHLFVDSLHVHHHQDPSKERNERDMSLMEKALAEQPDNHRMQYYYGRQLYFNQRYDEARVWLQKALDNPNNRWADERSQAMIYICWSRGGWEWLLKAIAEAPHRREPWYRLACWERDIGSYHLALGYAKQALSLPPIMTYIEDPIVQGDGPAKLVAELEELIANQNEEGAERESDPEVHPGAGTSDGADPEATGGDSGVAAVAEPVGAVGSGAD